MPSNSDKDTTCPSCDTNSFVKPKALTVDAAWVKEVGADHREAHFASIRVDDIKEEFLSTEPLRQFVNGFYCEKCDIGFIPDHYEKEGARYYYLRRDYARKDKT